MTYLGGKALSMIAFATLISISAAPRAQKQEPKSPNFSTDSPNTEEAPGLMTRPVSLHWTAPGDDGSVGLAASYDMRYVPATSGPINSEAVWNDAIQVNGEPLPSMAGGRDSVSVGGLIPGRQYYFCIRSLDEVGNVSQLSNSPLITINAPNFAFAVGDVNNSGDIDGLDVVYLVDALKGKNEIAMPDLRADVDGKCDINGLDVSLLRAYLGGGANLRTGACALDSAQLSVRHLKLGGE